MSKFSLFFKVCLILPPVWLSSLDSDLSINNIVRLGLADTKISSQDAVMKMLELTEKWKTQTSEVNSNLFSKFCWKHYTPLWKTQTSEVNSNLFSKFCWKHYTPLQLVGLHYSSAFYSTLLSFFCSQDIWI